MARTNLFNGKIDPNKLYLSNTGWAYGKAERLTLMPEPDARGHVPSLEVCLKILQEQQVGLLGHGLVCIDLADPDTHVLPWKGYIWFDETVPG